MAGFVDVLLRGLILALASVALGGVAWLRLVLRARPQVVPDRPTRWALQAIGVAAVGTALAQTAILLVSLGALADAHGHWPVAAFVETPFALAATTRVGLALAVGVLAWTLARRAGSPAAWTALTLGAVLLVVSSAFMSHAMARVEWRALLVALDAAHQIAAALWVGGLAHLTLFAVATRAASTPRSVGAGAARPGLAEGGLFEMRRGSDTPDLVVGDVPLIVHRFSTLAFRSMAALIVAGLALTFAYVGDLAAFVGTAYGVMVLSKVALLVPALALAYVNMRAVRRAAEAPGARLWRFVEVELGLGLTILFAAASLTSLPPAVDVTTDRATVAEVSTRFTPAAPRLTSPPIDELLRAADPLMARQIERKPVERAWSEYNHHWAGFFVVTMGVLALLHFAGARWARHWPLVFLGLAAFLFVRNDPRAWPLGPAGFWESLTLPDVLQHRTFVVLVVAFAVFQWLVSTGRLSERPWGYVFPLLCAVGGGLLLTHSHAMFNLKEEFLTEVTHAPLGILGAFAGWGRWLEVRLPAAGRAPGWIWRACFTGVGLILLFYREG
ncbi:MAG TPA: CopD family protein [Methylomirabilota bacterium]|nr:CopD family protein [Methylomirabilota bacterium]